MHCHGGVRSVGAEQLVDQKTPGPRAAWLRDQLYSGRAPANDLARRGHAVLVHDTFSWGSRLVRPVASYASAGRAPRGSERAVATAGCPPDRGRTVRSGISMARRRLQRGQGGRRARSDIRRCGAG